MSWKRRCCSGRALGKPFFQQGCEKTAQLLVLERTQRNRMDASSTYPLGQEMQQVPRNSWNNSWVRQNLMFALFKNGSRLAQMHFWVFFQNQESEILPWNNKELLIFFDLHLRRHFLAVKAFQNRALECVLLKDRKCNKCLISQQLVLRDFCWLVNF